MANDEKTNKKNATNTVSSANPAPVADATSYAEATAGWDKEQVGFAPFWAPKKEGDFFLGVVVSKDPGDPKAPKSAHQFARNLIRADMPLTVYRGKGEDIVEERIPKGDYFTCSDYHQLVTLFDFYRHVATETGTEIPISVKAVRKQPTSSGQEVWLFEVKTHPSVKNILTEKRREWDAMLNEGKRNAQMPQSASA